MGKSHPQTGDLALGPIAYGNEVLDNLRILWPSYLESYRFIAGFRSPFKEGSQFNVVNIYPPLVRLRNRNPFECVPEGS